MLKASIYYICSHVNRYIIIFICIMDPNTVFENYLRSQNSAASQPVCTPAVDSNRYKSSALNKQKDDNSNGNIIFAGDLSSVCTEENLLDLFSPYGKVQNVRIQRSKKKVSLGYAFVEMESPVDAFNTINELNGKLYFGRELRLGYAQHHAKVDSESILQKRNNSLYFRFIAMNTKASAESKECGDLSVSKPEVGVTEEKIREVFGGCGKINDVSIRRITTEAVSGYFDCCWMIIDCIACSFISAIFNLYFIVKYLGWDNSWIWVYPLQ